MQKLTRTCKCSYAHKVQNALVSKQVARTVTIQLSFWFRRVKNLAILYVKGLEQDKTHNAVGTFQLPRDVLYLHNDHIQAQNKQTANGVLFEATHLQWRCCVREISFLITSHQLTNELGERMGRRDNNRKMFDCY